MGSQAQPRCRPRAVASTCVGEAVALSEWDTLQARQGHYQNGILCRQGCTVIRMRYSAGKTVPLSEWDALQARLYSYQNGILCRQDCTIFRMVEEYIAYEHFQAQILLTCLSGLLQDSNV